MAGASSAVRAFAVGLFVQGTLCASAFAAAGSPQPAEELETIIITGSNIKDSDVQKALPVQVIDRESIERSGAHTAEQVLRQVSANLIGESPATSLNSGTPGLSSANLRGLGGGSTLVLINGHRSANYAFDGGAVDLGSMPLAAVQRIEVLKDGASAIYGADAMAGVINFILRPDYNGAEVTARATATQHGGGEQQQATASFGYGELARDGFSAFVTIDWQHYESLHATDRPFTSSSLIRKPDGGGLSSRTSPANINNDGDFLNPAYATGCAPPLSLPKPGTSFCGFDYSADSDIVPPGTQLAAVAGATLNPGAAGQLSVQLIYSRNDYTLRIAPTSVSPMGTLGRPVLYPADGPYYPTAFAADNGLSGDLNLLWRLVTLGPRTDDVVADSLHGTVALDGLAHGWDYDLALIYSRNNQTDTLASGYVSTSEFLPALYAGVINPFGPSTPAGQALLESTRISPQQTGSGTTWSLEAKGSRTLRELAQGRLAVATGIELRREQLSNRYSPEFAQGDILSELGTYNNTTSNREVAAFYTELNVPVATGAAAQIAARYDHFSDFGGTVNPKLALSWQLAGGVLLRASWGTGFRPPTLYDLHTPVTIGIDISDYPDPIRCPVTQLDSDCGNFYDTHVGGNPDLEPETSRQFNAGVVWSGFTGVSIGADYWQLHKNATIGMLDANTVLANYDSYGHYVERGPVDPAYPTLPGPITYIDLRTVNLGDLNTSGIDVNIEVRAPPVRAGRFALRLNGTYVSQWEQQLDGLNFATGAGKNLPTVGAVPRWRHYVALDWDRHDWAATLAENYSAGYTDLFPNPDETESHVASYRIWNCQASYRGIRHTLLAAGVNNLLDAKPPFSNQITSYQVGYDPRYADPLGRVYYGTVTYTLK